METLLGAAGPAPADTIKDSDTAGFRADVIDASMSVPVIVDFWATWCGPCKQLTPVLEKVVRAARGKVRLVKVDIDKNQQLAAQLRIQSVPTVYAFFQGRPVDAFNGALPESQVKQFVDRLADLAGQAGGDPVADALDEAKAALEQGDARTAASIYQEVMQHDPENATAIAGLARAMIALGRAKEARQLIDGLPGNVAGAAEITSVRSSLELAEQSAGAAREVPKLRKRLAADPDDHQARIDLAVALYGTGEREAAIEELLTSIRRDRDWNDQAARKQLLKFFEALGPSDPLTVASRRKLSSILFA